MKSDGLDPKYWGPAPIWTIWMRVTRAVSVKFERRDVWVGWFWDRRKDGVYHYVCPVPMVVIHWVRRFKPCGTCGHAAEHHLGSSGCWYGAGILSDGCECRARL